MQRQGLKSTYLSFRTNLIKCLKLSATTTHLLLYRSVISCFIQIIMNGRKLYRDYAQSKGKEAKEFVKIEEGWYNIDILITKDNNGKEERTTINYKDLVNWIIRKVKNGL